ncbi:DNA cytosine methyltransferase [Desulfosporosinus shakirovi]|uniref:DNA cytosine methyltransferase n=1 Tax=Desulfosporosinus shakirovi TaxID=2885154 RepID=UPI001E2B88CF|nr:DNA cytosine methyltransferase [Desulfosporosinus sp. SRJS8]MCB8818678.1 DNA cytosine methyltransferase [Desulfosporosinus sp. SRJS8]
MAYIQKFYKTGTGQNINEPLHTITTSAGHFGLVNVQLAKIRPGQDLHHWPEVRDMLNQYCGYQINNDEVLIFEINDTWYFISDIGLRMFTPRELFNAQGFPPNYIIDVDYYGNAYPRSAQVARCGHSVPPPFATALIWANMPEICMHVDDWGEWDKKHRRRQMSLF